MSASDAVTVSMEIEVEPDFAFVVFTRELDAWWGRGPRYRFLAPYNGTLVLEPGVGGRLLHVADETAGRVFVVGTVEVWEPPHRLALTWRLPNFAAEQVTRVSVAFEPIRDGTRVSVTHSGWDALPDRHPARHGLAGHDFVLMRGGWWGDLLAAVKRHAERSRHPSHAGGNEP
ncbi:MAG TPA: SRPBCC domain-containing protein [Dongiaceae bacterium]|nr:SRPBCC domain-containing protein [Dongiaceae bacterium]